MLKIVPLIIITVSLYCSVSVAHDSITPWHFNGPKHNIDKPNTNILVVTPHELTLKSIFYLYKHYISPINGEQCQMYPSCSEYCIQAINSFGAVKGTLMACDRLHRCGHDLKYYIVILEKQRMLSYDIPTD